jgi:hypothetical protein
MDITLLLSLIGFFALIVAWVVLPTSGEETATAPVTAPSASKA